MKFSIFSTYYGLFFISLGPSPNEISGECLGEVMAQDAKILELQAQLNETRSEVNSSLECFFDNSHFSILLFAFCGPRLAASMKRYQN